MHKYILKFANIEKQNSKSKIVAKSFQMKWSSSVNVFLIFCVCLAQVQAIGHNDCKFRTIYFASKMEVWTVPTYGGVSNVFRNEGIIGLKYLMRKNSLPCQSHSLNDTLIILINNLFKKGGECETCEIFQEVCWYICLETWRRNQFRSFNLFIH